MGSFFHPVSKINVFNNPSVSKWYVHHLKFSANIIKLYDIKIYDIKLFHYYPNRDIFPNGNLEKDLPILLNEII